ncbi:MipA/OmpV family protein [Roseateles sp. DC23W]|uniref:MipA/OmpV family protein n=1 Tax=Pelomonas dachongensis TaxID=3299029 RepID=A0ABW7EQW2_9BURK
MQAHVLRLAAALAVSSPALAQNGPPTSLTLVGIGAGATLEPYRGVDTKARVLPLLVYENDWVSVALPSISLKLGSTGPVKYRLLTRYAFDGYEAKDSDFLRGMDRRKESLWLGGAAIWATGMGELSLKLQGDTLGHSKGLIASLDFERRLDFGALAVTPRLGVRHVDRKYVDYYFGVKPSEALPDRPTYQGRSALQTEGGLRFTYATNRNESLFMDVSGRLLGSAVEDSPLVERRYQASLFAGWLYRF